MIVSAALLASSLRAISMSQIPNRREMQQPSNIFGRITSLVEQNCPAL